MASEERILVSVRLRPVNAREAERGDGSDWECAGPTTLMFHGNIPERAMFPASYTYGENACMHACILLLYCVSHIQRVDAQSQLTFLSSSSASDRVFNPECSTRQVYEEGAKQVALSVLSGINCTYICFAEATPVIYYFTTLKCKCSYTNFLLWIPSHQQAYLRTARRAAGRRTRWSASRSVAWQTSTTTLTRSTHGRRATDSLDFV
jgi:hypothetical protein